MNAPIWNSGAFELISHGAHQIEAKARARQAIVAGRHPGKEAWLGWRRRFGAGSGFAEELLTPNELPAESVCYLLTHFIAAGANGRAEHCNEISRLGTEDAPHIANRFFGGALERATPAGMHGGNNKTAQVGNEHGKAISRRNGEKYFRLIRHQRVSINLGNAASNRVSGRTVFQPGSVADHLHYSRGMNLPDRN